MKNLLGLLLILSFITCQDNPMPDELVTGISICPNEKGWHKEKIGE